MLNENSVNVKKQQFIEQNGGIYEIGQPWRKAYINSEQGRQQVQEEVLSPQKEAIFAIWGESPTVDESMTD